MNLMLILLEAAGNMEKRKDKEEMAYQAAGMHTVVYNLHVVDMILLFQVLSPGLLQN